ncbi:hypothetical protein K4F52_003026 [Lecanicillium sp. MT-2017a]|nr:hypothetical protein K4F52_003026 [Lecanicillium sp. MT-2017a]
MQGKPAQYMPSEDCPHLRTLCSWPDQISQKDVEHLEGAERDVATICNAVVKFEPVTLLCKAKNMDRAKALVSSKVHIQETNVDELWLRDTGPVYVKNPDGSSAAIDFNFNYWGDKYPGTGDSDVARAVLSHDGTKRVQAALVAEGGAIEVDGEGTLIATESSIVNDNRNPGASKEQLERHLKALLGVSKVIWVKGAKGLDITDWHIDALARFVSPGRILLSRPAAGSDAALMEIFNDAKKVLANATDAKGRKLEIVELSEADASLFPDADPYETVLSYINYLVVNGGVIIPKFGDDKADETALKLFRELFPGRKVEQILLTTLRKLGGGIHCATQQQPM